MRYRFTKEVLFDVATMLNRTSSFKYSEILACDQRIREFGPAKLFEQSVEAYVKSDSGGDHARSKLHVFLLTVMKDVSACFSLFKSSNIFLMIIDSFAQPSSQFFR